MDDHIKKLMYEFISEVNSINDIAMPPSDWLKCLQIARSKSVVVENMMSLMEAECMKQTGVSLNVMVNAQLVDIFVTWFGFIGGLFVFSRSSTPQFWLRVQNFQIAGKNKMPEELYKTSVSHFAYLRVKKGNFGLAPERVRESFEYFLSIKFEF